MWDRRKKELDTLEGEWATRRREDFSAKLAARQAALEGGAGGKGGAPATRRLAQVEGGDEGGVDGVLLGDGEGLMGSERLAQEQVQPMGTEGDAGNEDEDDSSGDGGGGDRSAMLRAAPLVLAAADGDGAEAGGSGDGSSAAQAAALIVEEGEGEEEEGEEEEGEEELDGEGEEGEDGAEEDGEEGDEEGSQEGGSGVGAADGDGVSYGGSAAAEVAATTQAAAATADSLFPPIVDKVRNEHMRTSTPCCLCNRISSRPCLPHQFSPCRAAPHHRASPLTWRSRAQWWSTCLATFSGARTRVCGALRLAPCARVPPTRPLLPLPALPSPACSPCQPRRAERA